MVDTILALVGAFAVSFAANILADVVHDRRHKRQSVHNNFFHRVRTAILALFLHSNKTKKAQSANCALEGWI